MKETTLIGKLTGLKEYKSSGHVMVPIAVLSELKEKLRECENYRIKLNQYRDALDQFDKWANKMVRVKEKL